MSANNWAHLRISASIHPSTRQGAGTLCVDWRFEAKPPGEQWTARATEAFGSERVQGVPWPPSRDDALAILTEVLMGVRWGDEQP